MKHQEQQGEFFIRNAGKQEEGEEEEGGKRRNELCHAASDGRVAHDPNLSVLRLPLPVLSRSPSSSCLPAFLIKILFVVPSSRCFFERWQQP
jgi:hypothetical protein